MVHADIDQARKAVSRYCVKPSERGWHLWRFYGWQSDTCGWRIVVADLRTKDDALAHLAKRLGLTDETPPAPQEPVRPVVIWSFDPF